MENNPNNNPDQPSRPSDGQPQNTPPPSSQPQYTPPPSQPTGGPPQYSPPPSGASGPPAQRPNTTTGLEPNVAGGLSYIMGIISGVLFFLIEKDRFVRFHAAQSVLTCGTFIALFIVMSVVGFIFSRIPVIDTIWAILSILLGIALYLGGFLLWIFLIVQAFQGKTFKLPFIGNYAEQISSSNMGQ